MLHRLFFYYQDNKNPHYLLSLQKMSDFVVFSNLCVTNYQKTFYTANSNDRFRT